MADKDKPAATTSEQLLDFSKLPASALDKYIDHYRLAERYPPYPTKRPRHSRSPSSSDEGGSRLDQEEDDEERASKRIDSNQTITTTTRLRPRSPTGQYFAGAAGGIGNGKRNGTLTEDGFEGAVPDANGKDWEVPCPSHFFDAQEADHYLATVASRHFASQPPPKEGEVVVQFLYRCRTGTDKCLKVAS